MPRRAILHCTRFFFLDSSNGAAIANRTLMECLSRHGFSTEVLCGTVVDNIRDEDIKSVLTSSDPLLHAVETYGSWTIGAAGLQIADPAHFRATIDGVPLTVLNRPLRRNGPTEEEEIAEFLSLFEATVNRFRPDVVVTYGGDPLTLEILARCRVRGISTVFTLHNFGYPSAEHFTNVDEILVPSVFSKRHYDPILGRSCVAIPCLTDFARVRAGDAEPTYVTFVNPSFEKGVFPFVRIADELGRRRPDIPLLVVESRGSESTIVGCGIDLRNHGNVFLMGQTPDPRNFWGVTRICLMPSIWWESQGLVAVEAMLNGIPVVASDRGALRETLGSSGICLSLPDWMTPQTRTLPSPEEIEPWVDAIIRLWDDDQWYTERSHASIEESRRRSSDVVGPQFVEFFQNVKSGKSASS